MAPGSAALAAALTMACALLQPGCLGPQASEGGGATDSAQAAVPASALEAEFRPLIDAHNARVAKLEALEATGVVEVWFREGDERKREQLDVDLLLASGGRGSLRLKKLSSDFASVGGDGRRSWIFDLRTKPARATVFDALPTDIEAGAVRALGSGEIDALSPASLRFMMGITSIPADARLVARPGANDAAATDRPIEPVESLRGRYCATWTRASVTARLSFGADGLPDEILLEDATGAMIATSRLSAYEPARVDGLSQLAWPKVATRFRANAPNSQVEAQFKLEATKLEAQQRRGKTKMFDLDALIAHFRPESVEYILREDEAAAPSSRAPLGDVERATP
ncbi:MAG: hypothetical protein LW806_07340 [Planctomycetaceae bacterium]|nr:hypothetical protein [Planctomycetaceae bacterium]